MTTARVRRIDRMMRGKPTHYYQDKSGNRLPGVTTVLSKGIPKPALINWAANTTAAYAVDRWNELADLPLSVRLERLKKARYAVNDEAKQRGTNIHAAAEIVVHGTPLKVAEDIRPHVEALVDCMDRHDIRPVLVERVVYTLEPRYARRAGTLDLIATIGDDPRLHLIDLKSGKAIYPETAIQLAAYKTADYFIDDNGDEQMMPEIADCYAIHVRADGADLIPVEAGEAQLKIWTYAAAVVAQFLDTGRDLIGAAVEPPECVA
jgi:hypothetical protein